MLVKKNLKKRQKNKQIETENEDFVSQGFPCIYLLVLVSSLLRSSRATGPTWASFLDNRVQRLSHFLIGILGD